MPCGAASRSSRVRSYGPLRSRMSTRRSGPTRPSGSSMPPASWVATKASIAATSAVGPLAGHDAGQAQQRLPLLRHLGLQRRRGEVGHVAHRELVEREVVVRALERGRAGQDDVGVAARLVDVDVQADEQVEPVERGLKPVGVRRRQAGVAAEREERLDLAFARCLDLVRERDDGQLAERLGQAPHAARPAAGSEAAGRRVRIGVGLTGGGQRRTSRRPRGRGCPSAR